MPKSRNLQSLFRGKKPRALGGGESKRRRTQYKSILGQSRQKEVSFQQVVKAARRYEKDPLRVPWFPDLATEVFISNAIKGKSKKFMENTFFKIKTTEKTKQFAKFWRSVGLNVQRNGLHVLRTSKEIEERLRRFIGNNNQRKRLVLSQVIAVRRQFEREQQKAYEQSQSLKYPNSSSWIRHSMTATAQMIQGRLENMEELIKKFQKL
mgnify:CR=1 FL=1